LASGRGCGPGRGSSGVPGASLSGLAGLPGRQGGGDLPGTAACAELDGGGGGLPDLASGRGTGAGLVGGGAGCGGRIGAVDPGADRRESVAAGAVSDRPDLRPALGEPEADQGGNGA